MSKKRAGLPSIDAQKKKLRSSSQGSIETLSCKPCAKTFDSKEQWNAHVQDWHSISGVVTLKHGNDKLKYEFQRDANGSFKCEICSKEWPTKSGFLKHLKVVSPACEFKILESRLHLDSSSSESSPEPESQEWRSFDDAILHASGKETEGESERVRTLIYAKKLEQFPVGFSVEGQERNALVIRAVYDALPEKPFLALVNKSAGTGQLLEAQPCLTCHPLSVPPIADLIEKTPFAKILGKRRYEELSKERIDDLNLNWTRYPEAPQVAGHMLAGAILYNTESGKGILLNEVEVYGRRRMEDCHREQSGFVKDVPKGTSIPSTVGKDHYKNVHPATVQGKDCGHRLVIGTTTCNILVTSCVRLGKSDKAPVSVGADTLNFEIHESQVQHIRIFLDSEQAETASTMVGKSVSEITKNKGIESLRQLKTKFSELDTYDLSRFSGPLTATIQCLPYTVFTFTDYGNGTGAAYGAGRLFYTIGKAVILHGDEARLSRKEVTRDLEMCRGSKEFLAPFEKIALLFREEQEIAIIGNEALSAGLKDLAELLSRKVADANTKEIKQQIQALFGLVIIKE
ncbi:hypothetical protein BGX34_005185 [Mortierella sp. NVP85]|nr:hypothetical protein BGX34_005185 [Mortierella sp. NVP85]